ncbi:hypothetical protein LCGC14_0840300 [marine sediment metagenome]|uniref:Uncharacterized protein n=1 Tax=marine sediment metagenome TaxID=412755 RepID=A0A0F9SKQ9_9ZZZZ|nr:hypothetical protein [Pricia sp.]
MSTGADLLNRARDRLSDATDLSFDNTTLMRYANDGAKEFTSTTGVLQSKTTINTDGAASTFSTSSVVGLINVFQSQYALVPLDFSPRNEIAIKWGASVGTPLAWSIWAETLYFDLIPTTATGDNAITIFYTRNSAAMDESDTSSTFDFPSEWEPFIVSYIVYRALDSVREGVLAERPRQEYDLGRQAAASSVQNKLLGGGYGN